MPCLHGDLKNGLLSLSLTTHLERSVLILMGPPHDEDTEEYHAIEHPHGSTEPTN